MKKEIRIECDGSHYLLLDEIHDFQGDLKDLSETNKEKLKQSLIQYGFSFPFFCWKDVNDKIWFQDGHSRKFVLKELESDGYKLPEKYPVCFIKAKDKKEAAEKLLLLNSKLGKVVSEGLELYIDKFDLRDGFSEFGELLDFDDISLDIFIDENIDENIIESNDEYLAGNIPNVEIQGAVENKSEYIIIQFSNEEDFNKVKEKFGMKGAARVIEFETVKNILNLDI